MTILTPAQLELLRTQPQGTSLYLSVYHPKTLLSAIVTGSYAFGDRQIYYNTITGSYLDVYPNSTLLLGTSEGDDDLGRIRVRSITGTYIIIAENDFTLQTGTYMTVLDYVDIVAVYPRIIQNPSNAEDVIFYKDYDIPYSNQNTLYGTFPCAGPHRATFVSPTGTVYYTATGTYNVLGNTVSYQWEFEGGTPSSSSLETPEYVQYGTAGHYKTKLTVMASGTVGISQDVTYRYVSVYDQPGQGNNPPIAKWEMTDFSGDRSGGGYTVGLKVFDNLGDIEPNALIVLFSQDTYGTANISLGGNAPNCSDILFVGYVIGDTIKFNYKDSWVEFKCGSVTDVMKQAEGFSVSCESKASPTTWFQLKEMTVQKALYHYLRWHSTILDTTDFQYTGDDRLVQYFDADRGSLYDAVNSFVDTGLLGETVADRQGKIWSEISPSGWENPFVSIPHNFTLQKQDWIDEPNITERRTSDVSVIEMGGIVYQGNATNGFYAYLSTAPSLTPYYRGKVESPREGLILKSQVQLNQLSGNYVANKNADYEDVTLSLAGNYRNIDIAPQERFFFDINSNDTLSPNNLLGWSFRPESMSWQYNPSKGTLSPQVSFSPIVTGTAGQTLLIPAEPPEIGYSYPSFNLPPVPYFEPFPGGITQQSGRIVLLFDGNVGMIYTTDFDANEPTWIIWNAGIDLSDVTIQDREFFITPNGAVWLGIKRSSSDYVVYRSPSVGGMFTKVIDNTVLAGLYPAYAGGGDNILFVAGMGYNPSKPEELGIIMGGNNFVAFSAQVNFWLINYPTFTIGAACTSVNNQFGSMTFDEVEKKWVFTGEQFTFIGFWDSRLWRFNETGSSLEYQTGISSGGATLLQYQGRARTTGRLYWWGVLGDAFYVTDDDGTTISVVGDSQQVGRGRWSYAVEPSGQFLMGNWTSAGNKGMSGDYGYSWTGLPNLPPGGTYAWAYAGGSGSTAQWIAGRGVLRYSENLGNTWENKEGNLLQICPIPFILGICVQINTRTI